jgi:hypothetical protein
MYFDHFHWQKLSIFGVLVRPMTERRPSHLSQGIERSVQLGKPINELPGSSVGGI